MKKPKTTNRYIIRWWEDGDTFAKSVQHMAYSEVEAIGYVMASHKLTDNHILQIMDTSSCVVNEYKGRKKRA